MSESDKQRLEILLKRKQKADSLPLSDRIKYKKQYDEICCEIDSLKNKLELNDWNFAEAMKLLIDANSSLALGLSWTNWGKTSCIFLDENPPIKQLITNAEQAVNDAFNARDMEAVKTAVNSYKEAFMRVNKIFNDPHTQMGFREVLEIEEGYKQNPWR